MDVAEPPLLQTLAAVDVESALRGMIQLRRTLPAEWVVCAEVDSAWYRHWEHSVAESIVREQGSMEPRTVSAHALIWYAQIPGMIGGSLYRLHRRVPLLSRESLAFRLAEGEGYPIQYGLLSTEFWCLPDDSAADHADATVVADDAALAAVLRGQVRAHADQFLDYFSPGARLPRRALLGAFQDAIENGIWVGGREDIAAAPEILASALAVLPGKTPEFREPATLQIVRNEHGADAWLCRDRIACCFRYLTDTPECATCPRVGPDQRRLLLAAHDHDH